MSSKRLLRKKSCTNKARHTKQGAIIAKRIAIKAGETLMAYYKCKFCVGWHIGHRIKRRTK